MKTIEDYKEEIKLINYELSKSYITIEKLEKRNKNLVNDLNKIIKKFASQQKLKNKKARNTKEYKKFRKKIIERDNYRCINCGASDRLEVHHIKPASKFPEQIMDESNVITLCVSCHSKTDSYFKGKI